MSNTDGLESSPGRPVALRQHPSAFHATASAIVRGAAPIADESCLEISLPRLLISGRSNCLTTTQLRPADDEERQLHRRTQAREIGGTQLTKLCALRIVILHEAVSLLYPTKRRVPPGLRAKKKKDPP
jgi:hypothetical protein